MEVFMKRIRVKQLFREKETFKDQEVIVCGWVRTNRAQAQFGFLNVNDGFKLFTITLYQTLKKSQNLELVFLFKLKVKYY